MLALYYRRVNEKLLLFYFKQSLFCVCDTVGWTFQFTRKTHVPEKTHARYMLYEHTSRTLYETKYADARKKKYATRYTHAKTQAK
jgi:hypothetical protein